MIQHVFSLSKLDMVTSVSMKLKAKLNNKKTLDAKIGICEAHVEV